MRVSIGIDFISLINSIVLLNYYNIKYYLSLNQQMARRNLTASEAKSLYEATKLPRKADCLDLLYYLHVYMPIANIDRGEYDKVINRVKDAVNSDDPLPVLTEIHETLRSKYPTIYRADKKMTTEQLSEQTLRIARSILGPEQNVMAQVVIPEEDAFEPPKIGLPSPRMPSPRAVMLSGGPGQKIVYISDYVQGIADDSLRKYFSDFIIDVVNNRKTLEQVMKSKLTRTHVKKLLDDLGFAEMPERAPTKEDFITSLYHAIIVENSPGFKQLPVEEQLLRREYLVHLALNNNLQRYNELCIGKESVVNRSDSRYTHAGLESMFRQAGGNRSLSPVNKKAACNELLSQIGKYFANPELVQAASSVQYSESAAQAAIASVSSKPSSPVGPPSRPKSPVIRPLSPPPFSQAASSVQPIPIVDEPEEEKHVEEVVEEVVEEEPIVIQPRGAGIPQKPVSPPRGISAPRMGPSSSSQSPIFRQLQQQAYNKTCGNIKQGENKCTTDEFCDVVDINRPDLNFCKPIINTLEIDGKVYKGSPSQLEQLQMIRVPRIGGPVVVPVPPEEAVRWQQFSSMAARAPVRYEQPSPSRRVPSPVVRAPSPIQRVPSPVVRAPSPVIRAPSPPREPEVQFPPTSPGRTEVIEEPIQSIVPEEKEMKQIEILEEEDEIDQNVKEAPVSSKSALSIVRNVVEVNPALDDDEEEADEKKEEQIDIQIKKGVPAPVRVSSSLLQQYQQSSVPKPEPKKVVSEPPQPSSLPVPSVPSVKPPGESERRRMLAQQYREQLQQHAAAVIPPEVAQAIASAKPGEVSPELAEFTRQNPNATLGEKIQFMAMLKARQREAEQASQQLSSLSRKRQILEEQKKILMARENEEKERIAEERRREQEEAAIQEELRERQLREQLLEEQAAIEEELRLSEQQRRVEQLAAEARQRAEQDAARQRAEKDAARQRAEQDAARQRAEKDAARQRAEQDAARQRAEQDAARQRAEQDAARQRAEKDAARQRAEQDAARQRAEQDAARQRAEQDAARLAAERAREEVRQEQARLAAEEERSRLAEKERLRLEAAREAARLEAERQRELALEQAKLAAEQQRQEQIARQREEVERMRLEAERQREQARLEAEERQRQLAIQEEQARLEEERQQAAAVEQARLEEERQRQLAREQAEEEAARQRERVRLETEQKNQEMRQLIERKKEQARIDRERAIQQLEQERQEAIRRAQAIREEEARLEAERQQARQVEEELRRRATEAGKQKGLTLKAQAAQRQEEKRAEEENSIEVLDEDLSRLAQSADVQQFLVDRQNTEQKVRQYSKRASQLSRFVNELTSKSKFLSDQAQENVANILQEIEIEKQKRVSKEKGQDTSAIDARLSQLVDIIQDGLDQQKQAQQQVIEIPEEEPVLVVVPEKPIAPPKPISIEIQEAVELPMSYQPQESQIINYIPSIRLQVSANVDENPLTSIILEQSVYKKNRIDQKIEDCLNRF
jgi:hypothetical protein